MHANCKNNGGRLKIASIVLRMRWLIPRTTGERRNNNTSLPRKQVSLINRFISGGFKVALQFRYAQEHGWIQSKQVIYTSCIHCLSASNAQMCLNTQRTKFWGTKQLLQTLQRRYNMNTCIYSCAYGGETCDPYWPCPGTLVLTGPMCQIWHAQRRRV